MEKIDARKLSTDAQQEIRYQVIRLKKQGRKRHEISEITGVHQSTISQWWKLYQKEGKGALKIKKRGRPTGDCVFRCKVTTHSATNCPPIPLHCDHSFRSIVTTHSAHCDHFFEASDAG